MPQTSQKDPEGRKSMQTREGLQDRVVNIEVEVRRWTIMERTFRAGDTSGPH